VEATPIALAASIRKYRSILIIIKGSPDPDAIASSFAMSALCHRLGVSSTIVSMKKLSLPENRAFISTLDIPVRFSPDLPDIRHFDAYIVTDFQSPDAREIAGDLPCAVFIDHHEPAGGEVRADFVVQNRDAGSTSTIVALLLKEMDTRLEPAVMVPVSTALLYGIYTDTDKYSHAGRLDYEAMDYLSAFSDHEAFNKISSIPLSKETLELIKTAIRGKVPYKDWLIAGVGYVRADNRDSIAVVADFLLKREKFHTVIVFAAIENEDRSLLTLDASLRSTSDILNLNDVIKAITAEGGARKFKGAYQINMDYFSRCPDRDLLWNVIRLTTIEVLKKSRDELYITELKGFYQKFRDRIRRFTG
jgi:nanoRNase/pAp phosphatase (c-di-AMP/oligoRNAs hydrolase)